MYYGPLVISTHRGSPQYSSWCLLVNRHFKFKNSPIYQFLLLMDIPLALYLKGLCHIVNLNVKALKIFPLLIFLRDIDFLVSFRSTVHLELTLIYVAQPRIKFYFFSKEQSTDRHHLVRKSVLPVSLQSCLCCESGVHIPDLFPGFHSVPLPCFLFLY